MVDGRTAAREWTAQEERVLLDNLSIGWPLIADKLHRTEAACQQHFRIMNELGKVPDGTKPPARKPGPRHSFRVAAPVGRGEDLVRGYPDTRPEPEPEIQPSGAPEKPEAPTPGPAPKNPARAGNGRESGPSLDPAELLRKAAADTLAAAITGDREALALALATETMKELDREARFRVVTYLVKRFADTHYLTAR